MIAVKQNHEPLVYSGQIKLPYSWTMGKTDSRFYLTLRDEGRIMGNRCPQCKKVYVPPRKNCGVCFCENDEWIEVGPQGTLEAFTIVRYHHDLHPVKAPFVYGNIKLEKADVGLTHLIGGVTPETITRGIVVEAVLKAERQGTILDILYFKPVQR